jgi:hypothetical protein
MIMKKLVPIVCLLLALSVTLNAKVPQAPATQGKLTGMVLDPAKVYVPGATISVKGRRVRRQLYSADDRANRARGILSGSEARSCSIQRCDDT